MYYDKRFDCHVHSDCSPRGFDSVMGLCEQAIHRNLMGFAVTDCFDCDRLDEMRFAGRVIESAYCVRKARAVFGEELIISSGIEIGQPLDRAESANKIIKVGQFDVVLASVKKYPDGSKISDMDYTDLTEREIIRNLQFYYELLYQTVRWGNFDVLSQLTLPMRYIHSNEAPYFSIRFCDDIIENILKYLADNGKALEVNTSAIRGKLNQILPPVRYLRMFKEFGGEFVTVGSGSHSAKSLGSDLSEGISLVYEAGFKNYCYFDRRKPVLINIE